MPSIRLKRQRAAGALGEDTGQEKPEPEPAAGFLGREEGLAGALEHLRRNAVPVIADEDAQPIRLLRDLDDHRRTRAFPLASKAFLTSDSSA